MKPGLRSVFPFVVALVLVCSPIAFGQELSKGEKDTVFIGQLNIQPSVQESAKTKGRELELKRVSESLDTQFITALNATRVFQLVERKRMKELQVEQAFASVAVNPADKNAAQALKMAGAKYAFLPQIDGFEDRVDKQKFDDIDRVSMSRKLFLSVVVQIVDTTTGKLLPDSPSIQLNKTEAMDMARPGQAMESDQVIVGLAKEMAGKLSQGTVQLLRPAKVLVVTGKQVMINRGSEAGFNKGDEVEICATQAVKDDDTGETFNNEVPVGKARIVRGDTKQSFAVLEGEDNGVNKGCVVRVSRPATSPAGVLQDSAEELAPTQKPSEGIPVSPGSSEKPIKFD